MSKNAFLLQKKEMDEATPTPQLTEVSREFLCAGRGEAVALCDMDRSIPPCYITVAWVFAAKRAPAAAALRCALEKTLTRSAGGYAPFAGALRADGSAVAADSSGALWSVAQCAQISLADFAGGDCNARALKLPLFAVPPSADYRSAGDSGLPLLTARYTSFRDGCVLAVAPHHTLCDGCGFVQFMHRWAAETAAAETGNGSAAAAEPQPSFSRAFLEDIIRSTPVPVPAPPAVQQQQQQQQQEADMSGLAGAGAMMVHWTAHELARLKELASADGGSDGQWVSTKDALLAHIWKTLVRASSASAAADEKLQMTFTLDVRKSFTATCPQGFVGNAAIVVHVEDEPTKAELLQESLRITALRIRRTVLALRKDDEKLRLAVARMAGFSKSGKHMLAGFKIGLDATASDWAAFDWLGLDFGNDCRPLHIAVPCVFPFPGLITIVPELNGGLGAYVHVTAAQAAALADQVAFHTFC